jgi:hypothetical protein
MVNMLERNISTVRVQRASKVFEQFKTPHLRREVELLEPGRLRLRPRRLLGPPVGTLPRHPWGPEDRPPQKPTLSPGLSLGAPAEVRGPPADRGEVARDRSAAGWAR